jgi:hypothetical protein
MATMDELYLEQQRRGPAQGPKRKRVSLTPEAREHKLVGYLRRIYGNGPDGATCGNCANLYAVGKYFKCKLGPQSRSEATDWRKKWLACGKFAGRSS